MESAERGNDAPWKTVFGWVERALEQATEADEVGRRQRVYRPGGA